MCYEGNVAIVPHAGDILKDMSQPTTLDHEELIIKLLQENQTLLQDNNDLLLRQERRTKRIFAFKIVWYALLIGVPMIAYYYLYNTFLASTALPGVTGGVDTEALQQVLQMYLGPQ